MYLVGLHVYYKMIHGPYSIKIASIFKYTFLRILPTYIHTYIQTYTWEDNTKMDLQGTEWEMWIGMFRHGRGTGDGVL